MTNENEKKQMSFNGLDWRKIFDEATSQNLDIIKVEIEGDGIDLFIRGDVFDACRRLAGLMVGVPIYPTRDEDAVKFRLVRARLYEGEDWVRIPAEHHSLVVRVAHLRRADRNRLKNARVIVTAL